jgi:hypothetical protein
MIQITAVAAAAVLLAQDKMVRAVKAVTAAEPP